MIRVQLTPDRLELHVNNPLIASKNDHSLHELIGKGIGMASTHRRLELLYPGKHSLTVHQDRQNKEYHVHLLY